MPIRYVKKIPKTMSKFWRFGFKRLGEYRPKSYVEEIVNDKGDGNFSYKRWVYKPLFWRIWWRV